MATWTVTAAGERRFEPVSAVDGLSEAVLLGPTQGSVHLEVALSELAPGATVPGHLHPFEESFFVLGGELLLALGDARYRLGPGGFGVVPLATPHAWANPGPEPARWLRARAPQPRPLGRSRGVYLAPELHPPTEGRPVEPGDPTVRHVGAFSDDHLPPPGSPLAMPGLRAPAVRNVSVWMLVDELLGARHHTLFVVQYAPGTPEARPAGDHFHPFEEGFYFLRGRALGRFEDEERAVGAGDLAWAGVGALHAFANPHPEPVRWLEIQAPPPPPAGAFFFARDWVGLEERVGGA